MGDWSGTKVFTTKSAFLPTSETTVLSASDAVDQDYFGYSVAISGDGTTIAVSSSNSSLDGTDKGSTYIYTNVSGTWTQQAKLPGTNIQTYSYSGCSLSLIDILPTLKCGDTTLQSKKVPASSSLLSISTRGRTLHRLTPYVTRVLYM